MRGDARRFESFERSPAGQLGMAAAALAARKINVRLSAQTYRYDEGAAPAPRVRASVHYCNTEEEITQLIDAL